MAISLTKGQKISLEKEAGGSLTKVIMGLGWDVQKVKGLFGKLKDGPSIDLDASCVLFDEAKKLVDTVWFVQLKSKDGSIVHTGDNRTGAGEGDDEQIVVDLSRVPANVKSLVFVVNSFTGQNFSQIENAFCRIVNAGNGQEIARYNLTGQGLHTAQIMAKLYRHGGEWKMHAIGENTSGRTFQDLIPAIVPYV
jgi:tellurium resistance protein TerZ